MSTILDALRKAHQSQQTLPEPERPVQESPPPEAGPPPGAERYHFAEEPVALAASPPEPLPAEPFETAPPPLPSEEPSLSDDGAQLQPEDPPSYLPGDDAGARRTLITRAVAVIVVGVLLGMLVGRRFTSSTQSDGDDLLTTAALESASGPKPAEKAPGTKESGPAVAKAEPSEQGEPSGNAEKAGRGARDKKAKRTRAHGAATGDAPSGATKPTPSSSAGSELEGPPAPVLNSPPPPAPPVGGLAVLPPLAAPPPVAATPPPAGLGPAPVPAALPFGAPPPAVMPPGGMAAVMPAPPVRELLPLSPPTPPAPAELPPPPDDAPDLALLFIQWSADAAKRVASVRQNSGGAIYIVREGDVVQGLRVAVIRPAGIEIQWRGQSFLLPASRY